MNEKLSEIKEQLVNLSVLINEFLNSQNEERIVIKKEEFNKIKHINKKPIAIDNIQHIFNYDNRCIFMLYEDSNRSYGGRQFSNLMEGTLDRLILNKRESILVEKQFQINYELERIERTKLFDLYENNEARQKLKYYENFVVPPIDPTDAIA